jgi:hypothetical protein
MIDLDLERILTEIEDEADNGDDEIVAPLEGTALDEAIVSLKLANWVTMPVIVNDERENDDVAFNDGKDILRDCTIDGIANEEVAWSGDRPESGRVPDPVPSHE